MLSILFDLLKIINADFQDVAKFVDIFVDRLQLVLVDNSWFDIRYPVVP
jgi:hypothetical protein